MEHVNTGRGQNIECLLQSGRMYLSLERFKRITVMECDT